MPEGVALQPRRASCQDIDGARLGERKNSFPRSAHGEIHVVVAVKIAGHQAVPEQVTRAGRAGEFRGILIPDFVSSHIQAASRSVEDLDAASREGAACFKRNTDSEVVAAIVVEVAGGQRPTELFEGRGLPFHARFVLMQPQAASRPGPLRAALHHHDRAGVEDASEVFLGHTDGEIVERIAIEVTRGEARAESISSFRRVGHAVEVLMQEQAVLRREAAGIPEENKHRTGAHDISDVFARDAHRQVGQPVSIIIAGTHCRPEAVVIFGLIRHPCHRLAQKLATARIETTLAAQEHHNPAGLIGPTNSFPRHAYRQVVEAVTVEITGGKACPKAVAGAGRVRRSLVVLRPELHPRLGQTRSRTVKYVHGAGIEQPVDFLARHANREVGESVTVEVAGNDGLAEAIGLLGGIEQLGVGRGDDKKAEEERYSHQASERKGHGR